jgi:hypothetical protein
VSARLDVGKVVLGAFLVPWWNRRAFVRTLAIPLLLLLTLSLSWHYFGRDLPGLVQWLLYALYGAFFAVFAVITHRLVLLDPDAAPARWMPQWSWRETRFFLWLAGIWSMLAVVALLIATLLMNAWVWSIEKPPQETLDWLMFAAKIPALYLFARVCLVFPASAIDRRLDPRRSWQLTRHNGWRLLLVVAVLPWALTNLVWLMYREEPTAVETVALSFLWFALFAVEVTALSLSYRELTKDEGSGTAPFVS